MIYALAVFDDGTGDALFAEGEFVAAGGVAANNLVRWNGAKWLQVGGGMAGLSNSANGVRALATFDDRNGEALFVGGGFAYNIDSSDSFLAK
ncbi:MAG: hypothetical protein ACI835_004950 [Planctomycetota bacterium]